MKIGSDEWSQVIIDGGRAFDLDLDRGHAHLFAAHARELLHWNNIINLTAITDPYEVALKHFVDSLAPARLISPGTALLDIGSGGGFPGIPLKVAIPTLSITLIDSSRKKINFLKHVIRTLGIEGIEALHLRAEELAGDSAYREHFDFITSRALTDLKSFVLQALPLLVPKGAIIALKGKVNQAEMQTVRSLLREKYDLMDSNHTPYCLAIESYELPFTPSQRSILLIKMGQRSL